MGFGVYYIKANPPNAKTAWLLVLEAIRRYKQVSEILQTHIEGKTSGSFSSCN
jgi:hypothetical protein